MTFLELVQDLARQSGTLAGGTTIASVSGVTGRAEKLVNWIASAWTDIQNQRDWNWMRGEFTSALAVGTKRYTAAGSFSLTRFRKWVDETPDWQPLTIYDDDIGVSDEAPLSQIPYTLWRTKYDRGTQENSRPVEYAFSPSGELCVGPVPDDDYVVRGEYWKSAQTLSANADTPEMPTDYHKIIVYRAMALMAAGDESVPTLQFVQPEYRRLFHNLCVQQLPSISTRGNAMA